MNTTWAAHCPDIECEDCANSIKSVLGKLAGVGVDVVTKTVTVTYDMAQTSNAILRERLTTLGFPPQ